MSDNLDVIRYKTSKSSAQFVIDNAKSISRFIGDLSLTIQDVIDGLNSGGTIPKTKSTQSVINFGDFKVYVLGKDNSNETIMYIHGGGYLFGLYPNLVEVMDVICEYTNKQIYILDYGLPMKYNWKDAYSFLASVYKFLQNQNKNVIIIGDSAGGGLGLGFIEQLKLDNQILPIKQVLISPWLDITMSNPEAKHYDKIDQLLDIDCLVKAGKIWANGLDGCDYRLSPIFGDLKNIPETLVTTGTMEVMYPDIIDFSNNLTKLGTKVKLIICEGMYHAYPFLPVEESRYAIQEIVNFIDGQ